MRNGKWRAAACAAMLVVFSLLLTSCGDAEPPSVRGRTEFADTYQASDTWTVYWYLCGSDLESEYGAATADLEELMETELPDNVRIIIEAGGAKEWRNDLMSAESIGRYVYDKDGLRQVEDLPDADMGDAATLADFLRFGEEHYAADHKVFVFWNHGGGSAAGVCFDERTGNALSLNDIRQALAQTSGADAAQPPFELVGFDACLMSTYATLNTLHGYTRYVVASEETEPGNGWNWTGWVQALADHPEMGGAKLGKCIADTYYEGCVAYGTEDDVTLSVLEEEKLPALSTAYDAFCREALRAAQENPQHFAVQLGRSAGNAENYGGNTREEGYANMVDLANLVEEAAELVPRSGEALQRAIDDAVVYRVSGPFRSEGRGLSSYYSYNGDADDFLRYAAQDGAARGAKFLYYYLLFGEQAGGAEEYLAGDAAPAAGGFETAGGSVQRISVASLEDKPVDIDEDGTAHVTLDAAEMDLLDSVHCQLFYFEEEENIILCLGTDTNVDADWETGVFKDNFDGTWPMLDGHPVYIELTAEEDGYNLYAIPIKLNGSECNLIVAYSFEDEAYHILGARKGIDAGSGMAEKQMRRLKVGDTITTVHYASTLDDDSDMQAVDIDTFQVTEDMSVRDEKVGEGSYGYFFEFLPPSSTESALSAFVRYDIDADGGITTRVE